MAEPENVEHTMYSSYYMTDRDKNVYTENKTKYMNALYFGEFK